MRGGGQTESEHHLGKNLVESLSTRNRISTRILESFLKRNALGFCRRSSLTLESQEAREIPEVSCSTTPEQKSKNNLAQLITNYTKNIKTFLKRNVFLVLTHDNDKRKTKIKHPATSTVPTDTVTSVLKRVIMKNSIESGGCMKKGFTLAEGAAHVANCNNMRKSAARIIGALAGVTSGSTRRAGFAQAHTAPYPKFGFTLAEVLITLGIIGIVAAMTMPTLMAHNKKVTIETRLKKSYSIMNQAVTLSIANGTWTRPPLDHRGDNILLKSWMDTALLPYLKHKECENVDGRICIQMPDGSRMYFHNNAQIHINYYINKVKHNGKRGIDIFYFFLDYEPTKLGYFYPSGYSYTNADNENGTFYDKYVYGNREDMIKFCKILSFNDESNTCALLIMHDGWEIKDDYPIKIK